MLDLLSHLLGLDALDHLLRADLVAGVGIEHAQAFGLHHADIGRDLAALHLPGHAEVGQGEVGGEQHRRVLVGGAQLVELGLHGVGHLRVGVHVLHGDQDGQQLPGLQAVHDDDAGVLGREGGGQQALQLR